MSEVLAFILAGSLAVIAVVSVIFLWQKRKADIKWDVERKKKGGK